MMTIAQALNVAVQALDAGRTADAINICQRILEVDQNNINALHVMGVAYRNEGRYEDALILTQKAIEAQFLFVETWLSYATTLSEMKRHAEAVRIYRIAVTISPESAKVWRSFGIYLANHGGSAAQDQKISVLGRAKIMVPDDEDVIRNLGVALRAAKRFQDGIEVLKEGTRVRPESAPMWMTLGISHLESSNYEKSEISFCMPMVN
jgi:Tfp pilus assembly protein PilF